MPTANVEMTSENQLKASTLLPGIYSGEAVLEREGKEDRHKAAISIGYCPTYKNTKKTVEAFLLKDFGGEQFYGANLKLELKQLLRAEGKYESFADLIDVMQMDI